MEAMGNSQWFIELVEDLGHAIWIGDAAQIRASYVRKQKTDKRDAEHSGDAGGAGSRVGTAGRPAGGRVHRAGERGSGSSSIEPLLR